MPPLACAQAGWAGLPVALECLPARGEVANIVIPHATLALIRSGSGKRWLKSGRHTDEFVSAPGAIHLLESGFLVDEARWSGSSGEVIGIQFPEIMVNRLLHDDARPLNLQTRHARSDPRLSTLVHALWDEAANASPLGPLYAQGITLAMIGLLDAGYGTGRAVAAKQTGKFGARDVKRLRALVAEQLGEDLRIERLAECVSMSPNHFARTFKATFGQSPHAFVLEQRIQAAAQLLRAHANRNVADVASECGFPSHAHFTEVFRKMIGTTPARWRHG